MPSARLAILLLLALAWTAPAAKDAAFSDWLSGATRYLATKDEIKEFKSLKSDADRAEFIERFWRRRDPTPSTLNNEYRQLFWQRVKEANEKFLDSAAPGWKTDRGKIYILYGPPEEVREDPNARTESKEDSGAGLIRWTYLKPGGRRDVDAIVYVPFVRNVSGEYKLSNDPELASPFFNWNDVDNNRLVGIADFLANLHSTSKDELGVMLDLGKLQEVPPQEQMILDSVEAVETFAFQPLPLAIDRYEPAEGKVMVVVTVSVPGPAGSEPPTILGRFGKPDAPKSGRLLGEGSFRVEGDGDARVAQARIALDPGGWDVTVLAVDGLSGSNRIYRGKLEPWDQAPLRTSDVVLARVMEPLPYAAQASYDAPYIVGGFRVTPRVALSVPRGEPIRLFYEVYGGTPPFRFAYQLEGREDDGRWRALGAPQERTAVERGQGFELPTKDSWPSGVYRVTIRASDAAGHEIVRTSAFTLTVPSGP